MADTDKPVDPIATFKAKKTAMATTKEALSGARSRLAAAQEDVAVKETAHVAAVAEFDEAHAALRLDA